MDTSTEPWHWQAAELYVGVCPTWRYEICRLAMYLVRCPPLPVSHRACDAWGAAQGPAWPRLQRAAAADFGGLHRWRNRTC
jgi:hypothetical protein